MGTNWKAKKGFAVNSKRTECSFLVLLVSLFLALTPAAWAQKSPAPQVKEGQAIYEKWCAQCHGAKGDGEGPASPLVEPRPRDFTLGYYKLRSTPSGQLPSDADILKVISEGMPGTSMPGWKRLSEKERLSVAAYLKSLSARFASEPAPKPINVTKEIAPSRDSIQKGQKLYQDLECFKCHGDGGRGDGPSAPELEDDWGHPIRPANLTKPWLFRGGSRARDIYLRFMTGMTGTPMPSYEDSLESPEQAWHLANYVTSLGRDGSNYGSLLVAKYTTGPLPKEPGAPAWEKIPGVNFPLVGQVIEDPRLFNPSIDMITVKALYNDKEVAFLLIWDDPSESEPIPDAEVYADAVAVQFPTKIPEGQERPFFLMGDDARPVYLLKWSSESPAPLEINAWGVKKQKVQAQPQVRGLAVYHQGQYRLLVVRPLSTPDKEDDIQFEAGRYIPVAFMAWDGSNGETEGKMALSSWYYFLLEPRPSSRQWLFPPLAALVAVGLEFLIRVRVRKAS